MNDERLAAALADRYRIERELGQGGMATVYLAHDLRHDRQVALKVLKPELAAVLGAERFVVEIKTTASLQHPHILPLFDSGSADGFLFYVMPFIDGETLRDKLTRESQLGVDQAVKIASEVADALDYAHRKGIIHRDIKPENILLHDGRPMVADFGIALAVSAAAGGRMTETGLSLGTPHYMSPEQATADREITARSDVYSLASVLYEMLAGQPPHLGGTAQMIIMKIIAEPVELVTKYRKAVPPHVAAALAKALEKLPADRFESARAFRDALANPSFTNATTAIRAGSAYGSGVSRPAFLATAAVALVALGAAAWGWLRPGPAPQISRFEVELPGYSVAVASAFRVALSPDGRQIVYAADVASGRQLMRRRLEELTPQPIPGTEGGYNPAFSPAGDKIAFVAGSPRALKVVSLAGGPPAVLTDSLVDSGGVTWSPDGYIYYDAALEGDGIARIRATGGTPEIASRPANDTESWHTAPAALPNGKGVLFHMARGRGALPFDVAILDTRTGIHRMLFRGVAPRYVPTGHLLYTTETGVLMAIRFDPDRLAISGEATPVADGLLVRSLGRVETSIAGNGTLIYVAGTSITRMRELVWISRDGSMTPADTTWRAPITTTPWISPDGSRAVMAVTVGARPEVWVKQLDRGPATRLAEAGLSPGWTPGGREVVFYGNGGAAEVPADGSVAPTIRFTYRDAWDGLRYSPDGQWLIGTSAGDIFGRRTAGDSAMVPLVSGPGIQRRAVISPDGRWLAYDSDEGGVTQVYVRPFPATQTGKYQISTNGGAMPHWSRDGRELFYAIPRITRSEILAVPVSLTPVFSAGAHRTLFRTDALGIPFVGFDVHPDGKRFLFARPLDVGTSAADRLVVVENFFEVLKEKLP